MQSDDVALNEACYHAGKGCGNPEIQLAAVTDERDRLGGGPDGLTYTLMPDIATVGVAE